MNLKLKKIKRELVVSHASEIAMGIDSQEVHDHVADAQPSSSAMQLHPSWRSHMLEMIKRAIDKALAPVRRKIQDLEHGVSELEGIGVRDALAALKADMSKPDLSIFDAPLPEDDVFEDERAETDEEELEEEYETKEIDKE
ncbi:hypothetical protein HAX54_048427 [Datura stramonium]|uniref:Uncharacterized protein n=1 Tax=Datura stramonium TaxID=4076 RepID=A0ABS8RKT2_DATST|nr:hypothetical protein [Datura stramonium]